ncbi:hypothetical protein SERLADRAFT_404626 [Serpula lacrymans var. lacrymans S7.9]|uniref:Uncharacterized protein n=1 Tax=Serpula lacrymans var. lacrymans (strain S7.9) TaxID=578457 RepID=F8NE91_SERL9|nr:uncharacterized protein SERLADRAFT_404626 [Serpula lacrymans var. lacrymans S7.9]EGO30473.1 hypothetical protein SERLADRAFT_404626 [Serpula lacrymans var. lacrymans S7.9]
MDNSGAGQPYIIGRKLQVEAIPKNNSYSGIENPPQNVVDKVGSEDSNTKNASPKKLESIPEVVNKDLDGNPRVASTSQNDASSVRVISRALGSIQEAATNESPDERPGDTSTCQSDIGGPTGTNDLEVVNMSPDRRFANTYMRQNDASGETGISDNAGEAVGSIGQRSIQEVVNDGSNERGAVAGQNGASEAMEAIYAMENAAWEVASEDSDGSDKDMAQKILSCPRNSESFTLNSIIKKGEDV